MLKKITLLLLVAIMLISLSACGATPVTPDASTPAPTSESTAASTEATVEASTEAATTEPEKQTASISIWVPGWEQETVKTITADAVEWEAKTGTKVEVIPIAADGFVQKLLTATSDGTNPDVLMSKTDKVVVPYGSKDVFLDLGPFGVDSLKDKFHSIAWQDQVYNGKVYGLKATLENFGILYNKNMFDTKGIKYPDENTTWADFKEMCKQLTDPAAGIYGFDKPWSGWPGLSRQFLQAAFATNGVKLLNEERTKAAFNTPEALEVLQVLYEMANVDKSISLEDAGEGVDKYKSNLVAIQLEGTFGYPYYATDPEVAKKVGVAPLPKMKDTATLNGGFAYFIYSNTKSAQASYDYIVHLSTDEAFLSKIMVGLPSVPTMKTMSNFYDNDPFYAPLIKMAASIVEKGINPQDVIAQGDVNSALDTEISKCLLEGKDPAKALADAEIAVNEALKE